MVLYVGANRLYAFSESAQGPRRTTAAELATLRDFDAIEVKGDFAVDIVQEASYSVAFTSPAANRGEFIASVRGDTLVLHGFQHAPANRVRVGMPALRQLDAGEVPALTVSGFSGASVSLRVDRTPQLVLRNNAVRQWHIFASEIGELQVDKTSVSAGKVELAGRATLTVIE